MPVPPLTGPSQQSDSDGFQQVAKPKKSSLRRVQSDVLSNKPTSSLQRAMQQTGRDSFKSNKVAPKAPTSIAFEYPKAEECKKKMKNLLKEYFVGGDTADAVLSVDELVGCKPNSEKDDSVTQRGAAIVEAGVLLVLERKESDVKAFLKVIRQCLSDGKLLTKSLALGLRDPLEYLRDVEIDAPLASKFLAQIIADWMTPPKKGGDGLSFLLFLQAPEYFKTDGRPADFLKQVLGYYIQTEGCTIAAEHIDVVSKLMSEEERTQHGDVRKWLESS